MCHLHTNSIRNFQCLFLYTLSKIHKIGNGCIPKYREKITKNQTMCDFKVKHSFSLPSWIINSSYRSFSVAKYFTDNIIYMRLSKIKYTAAAHIVHTVKWCESNWKAPQMPLSFDAFFVRIFVWVSMSACEGWTNKK